MSATDLDLFGNPIKVRKRRTPERVYEAAPPVKELGRVKWVAACDALTLPGFKDLRPSLDSEVCCMVNAAGALTRCIAVRPLVRTKTSIPVRGKPK